MKCVFVPKLVVLRNVGMEFKKTQKNVMMEIRITMMDVQINAIWPPKLNKQRKFQMPQLFLTQYFKQQQLFFNQLVLHKLSYR